MKLLIKQGKLVDPVGGIGGIMDVLIEDGKVAVIGSYVEDPEAQVLNAEGLGRIGVYACSLPGARL